MTEPETFEFEVTVTVRKRLWLSGPNSREIARALLQQTIPLMGCGAFAKRGVDGHDIETIISNEIEISDPA